MGRQQGITSHLWAHLTVAQDEMRQDRKHRFTRGALHAPNGEPTQADSHIMGVAHQAPATTTAGLVFELKAQGEEKSEDEFDKCLAIINQLKVSGVIVEINGNRAVFPCGFGCLSPVSPSVEMAIGAEGTS
jgi:hypothetical protein